MWQNTRVSTRSTKARKNSTPNSLGEIQTAHSPPQGKDGNSLKWLVFNRVAINPKLLLSRLQLCIMEKQCTDFTVSFQFQCMCCRREHYNVDTSKKRTRLGKHLPTAFCRKFCNALLERASASSIYRGLSHSLVFDNGQSYPSWNISSFFIPSSGTGLLTDCTLRTLLNIIQCTEQPPTTTKMSTQELLI